MTMSDYSAEKATRTAQFAACLRLMGERSRTAGDDGCYVIFNESPEARGADRTLKERLRVSIPVAADAIGTSPPSWISSAGCEDLAPHEYRPPPRFVQFAFDETLFYMDLPKTTLERPEAERLLRNRSGFFFMAARPRFPYYQRRYAVHFNPVCKVYLQGDQETAAEDMAYVVFDLWRFPVDWRFFVTAGAFDGTTRFESDTPLG